ncbi:MAG: hypothetical protein ACREPM_04145 [Gemmatimonadaceae bacterium]
MGIQQQVAKPINDYSLVPADVAAAATRYQAFREVEAEHLALMARFNLALEWTPEVRQVVFNAGDHIRHARGARMAFRHQVRDFVLALRRAREPLSSVLQRTRTLLRMLETQGALRGDGGRLEAEVLEWAIEEYENAA